MAVSLYSSGSTDALLAAKLSDAPIDGSTYGRLDGAWAVVAGGGGLTVNDLSNGATSTLNATVPTTGQALTYDGTDLKWATISAPVTSVAGRTGAITLAVADVSGAAPTASPSLSGTPLAPTATVGTNTTQIATTAFVLANAGSGGAAVIDIQTFSTAGTTSWTKPAGAKLVVGYMWGSGGGGGSGARNATTGARSGGAGGCGGSFLKFIVDASVLSASETVVIGTGGVGGAAQTTNATAGIGSSVGSVTSFASRFQCTLVTNASGGSLTVVSPGTTTSGTSLEGILLSTNGINSGGNGTLTTGGSAVFSAMYYFHSSGGGGGAGAGAGGTTAVAGGPGGTKPTPTTSQCGLFTAIAGGSGGTAAGVIATTGTTGSLSTGGGTGGGGGAYRTGVAGMAGAAGAWPGGGGGGGSASDNGFASGAGGAGASGGLILITYF